MREAFEHAAAAADAAHHRSRELQFALGLADTQRSMGDRGEPYPGVAGNSAHRELERRRERRKADSLPRSRFLALVLGPSAEERRRVAEEKRWASGARGEELVAESLARRCPTVPVLHDRQMPHSRANIDHIGITASGVYVIDAKRYRGKIEVCKPLLGSPKLKIAGRDRTKLLDGLGRQVAAVQASLEDLAIKVKVQGCFCFVAPEGLLANSGVPVLKTLRISGYPLYDPRRLAKQLNRPGPLSPEQIRTIHAGLADRLSPA
jgi:hypothetical protein